MSSGQVCGDGHLGKIRGYSGPDVPDDEILLNGAGRVMDDAYADAAVEDAVIRVLGPGRPPRSLTQGSRVAPSGPHLSRAGRAIRKGRGRG